MEAVTKKRLEVLLAILVLIALIVVIILVFRRPGGQAPGSTPDDTGNVAHEDTTPGSGFVPVGPPQYTPEPIARGFVERFGSFSTESNFNNISDVFPLATLELQAQLKNLQENSRRSNGSAYYGVSTRIIAMKTVEKTDSTATLEITTQRQESIDSPANTNVRYQDIVVTLVKSGEQWLVDDYTWK